MDATSIETVTAIVEGRSSKILGWLCDVRDVARAHVLAAEAHLLSHPAGTSCLLDA